jgi:hypothetical protein
MLPEARQGFFARMASFAEFIAFKKLDGNLHHFLHKMFTEFHHAVSA